MADLVVPAVVGLCIALVVAYVALIRWRMRVHRQRRAEAYGTLVTDVPPLRSPPTGDRPAAPSEVPAPAAPVATAASGPPAGPPGAPAGRPGAPGGPVGSVADAVAGIVLPDSLSPLVEVAPHPSAVDRAVFFARNTTAETVRSQMTESLAAIGRPVAWTGDLGDTGGGLHVAVIANPADHALAGVRAYPTAPEDAVVVDLWLEAG